MYASLSTLPGKLNRGLISARRWALVKLTGCEDDNVCLVRPSWGRFSEVQFKKFYPLIKACCPQIAKNDNETLVEELSHHLFFNEIFFSFIGSSLVHTNNCIFKGCASNGC